MSTFLRTAGAFVLGSVFTSAALASPAMDAAFNMPGWSETCALPSVTASSTVIHDEAVQTVSDNEPTSADSKSADSNHDSCTSCNQSSCSNGCNECSQNNCCYCCPPQWYASAGTIILHRNRPDAGTVVAGNPGGTPFSSASDFGFGWDAGVDVTLGYRLNCCDSIEGRFFDDDGASDNNNFVTPGNFIGAGFTGPGGTNFAGRYTTQLYSSELNWRHTMNDQVTFITGFRWIDLSDEMDYRLNTTTAEGDYKYTNQLYGAQVGLDWKLTDRCNPLQIDAVGKAGLYGNQANGGIYEFQGAGRTFIGSFTGVNTDTAFVGELDFTATYKLTCHMSVHGGYELLWLNDVALAGNAGSRSLLNPSLLRTVDNGQNLFYNGATTGIDFTW